VIERTIPASTHGRYLVEPADTADPAPLLVGFHGYAEAAETQLERLRAIPGSQGWLLVSVQGLHRFYRRRSGDVVAGWMTRQDRDLAIADNRAFIGAVIDEVALNWRVAQSLVFAGFSQGVAMAFRAACSSSRPVSGIIALGGDVPPELDGASLARTRTALLGRGQRDEWYSADLFVKDAVRLREAGVDVRTVAFDSGHEWTPAFSAEAGAFLERQTP
jgi:predicted esterase